MSRATCYLRVEARFADSKNQRVKELKVVELRQTPPPPQNNGFWVKFSIDIDDGVFVRLIPEITAEMQLKDMEAMVAGTELYRMITGEDEEGI